VPAVIACGSGRAAIELALRATGVQAGAEVIVPTFCCTSVVAPILAVGAVPVLADVGDELNLTPQTVAAAFTSRTTAVVVPHLFGNPAQIQPIVELCRPRGIVVIDDAAQALGAGCGGRALGTFGDVGVVSFGNGKVCFGTGGGVLLSRNAEVLKRAAAVALAPGSAREGVRQALSTLVWRRWRRWTLPLQMALTRLQSQADGAASHSLQAMRNLDAAVALTLLDTLDDNLGARSVRVAAYQHLLAGEAGVTLVPHRSGSACVTQVLQIARGGVDARRLISVLRAAGYEANDSYKPLHLQPDFARFAPKPLTNAERLWGALVELPCEPSVSLRDVGHICTLVRATVARL